MLLKPRAMLVWDTTNFCFSQSLEKEPFFFPPRERLLLFSWLAFQ